MFSLENLGKCCPWGHLGWGRINEMENGSVGHEEVLAMGKCWLRRNVGYGMFFLYILFLVRIAACSMLSVPLTAGVKDSLYKL